MNAECLSYENIVNGLLSGDFYSSMGPEIYSLYVEDGRVYVECSDAKRISYSTRGRRAQAVNACDGERLDRASFEIRETDGYFRIDVVDEKGQRANTQAYFVNEI